MGYATDSAPKRRSSKKSKAEPTKKEDAEELCRWKALLCIAADYQKKCGNIVSGTMEASGRWDVNVKAMDGDFNSRQELGDEAIDVNITHSTIQTLLSPLWTTEPHITIEPTMARVTDGDQEYDNILHADITETEVNYWVRELSVRNVVKKCVLDNAATNQGFAYIGYIRTKGEITNSRGEETENEPQIRFKQPFVKRVSPKMVLMPKGYYDLEECPWVAVGFSRCVEDVKDRYDIKDLKAESSQADSSEYSKMDGMTPEGAAYLSSDDAGYVTVWQIWSKRPKKLISITMNHDEILAKEDWPYDMEGFPLEKMRFDTVPDQQFGMPLMTAWMAQQKEVNVARTATRRRQSRIKSTVFMRDAPDGVEEAYKKGEDGTIINLKNSDTDDIRKILMVDQGLPPDNSSYAYGATQMQDLFTISGLGANQRSQGDPNSGSATESALIDKWAQIRQTDYGDIVRGFYLGIVKKLWMILKQFPDVKRDMLVTGPTGQMQRITYTLAELRGEFNFTMDLGSMFGQDPMTRRQNAFARYNLLRQDPLVRGDKLVSDLLKADNIHDVDSYMTKLLSPQEEFMKMLQGLPCEANELDDQISHMKQHEAQGKQLEVMIAKVKPGSPEETQARSAMVLLIGHVNDHARIMQMMDSKNPAAAGSPVASNMLKAGMNAPDTGETDAEMGGQPVGQGENIQTPDGISVQ